MTIFFKEEYIVNPRICLCFTVIVVEYTVSLEKMGL